MDPLSHIVAGRAVVALVDTGRHGRGLGAAAILGALSPDIDLLLAPAGWDVYLRGHQAGTHSIVGGLLVACAGAALVRGVVRGSRYAALIAAATGGAMSHLALDVISGARIRLAWPFADPRVGLPLIAMADPWFVAICVAGLLALWPGRQRLRTVAVVMLGTAIAFLCLKAALLCRADRLSRLDAASAWAAEVPWGSLTEWDLFDRTPTAVRTWRISGLGGPAVLRLSRSTFPESALVTASRSLDTVKNLVRSHEFVFAVEAPEGDGRTAVRWSDLRYCRQEPDRAGDLACALWFGGVFDRDRRALTQEVMVGTHRQTRPAPR